MGTNNNLIFYFAGVGKLRSSKLLIQRVELVPIVLSKPMHFSYSLFRQHKAHSLETVKFGQIISVSKTVTMAIHSYIARLM